MRFLAVICTCILTLKDLIVGGTPRRKSALIVNYLQIIF